MNGPCVQQSAPLSYSLACVTCITVACGLHFSLSLRASKVGDKSNSTNYSIDTARTLFTTTFKNQPATDHPASLAHFACTMASFAYQRTRRASKLTACTKPKLIPPPARHRRLPPPRSRGAIRPNTMCRSRSCSAASATPICTRCATSGATCMPTVYPCVPGHEIVGRVTKVGSAVTKFKPGDLAAVGCMVDSDRHLPRVPGRASSSSART